MLEQAPIVGEDRSKTDNEGFVWVRTLFFCSKKPYCNSNGRWKFGLDINYAIAKTVTPIIKSALMEGPCLNNSRCGPLMS